MVMDGMSMDLEQTNMEKLRSVFPECFSENKLDIDKLLALLRNTNLSGKAKPIACVWHKNAPLELCAPAWRRV